MKKNVPAHATCVEDQPEAGGALLPTPAVVVVLVVLLLTTALVAYGLSTDTVIAAITTGGTLGVALARQLTAVLASRPGHRPG